MFTITSHGRFMAARVRYLARWRLHSGGCSGPSRARCNTPAPTSGPPMVGEARALALGAPSGHVLAKSRTKWGETSQGWVKTMKSRSRCHGVFHPIRSRIISLQQIFSLVLGRARATRLWTTTRWGLISVEVGRMAGFMGRMTGMVAGSSFLDDDPNIYPSVSPHSFVKDVGLTFPTEPAMIK